MKIVHFAPFGPNACGLYEAARDMIVADRQAGYDSELVDTGAVINGKYVNGQGKVGQEDNRGRDFISTASPLVAREADILIAHTGTPDPWISTCQAPLIWMLHGRPQACFRPEQFGHSNSYSLLANVAAWPRVKKVVSFWPYHRPFWLPIIPEDKLVVLDAPPIDQGRFGPDGPAHDYGVMGGEVNVVLADSMREDIDLYEVTNGAIAYARANSNVKFHFYAIQEPLLCWEHLIGELRMLGSLGEVWARRPMMEEIYRAADIVLSPHRITTRVIAEAICCGTPVIAARGNEHSSWHCDPADPYDVADAILIAVKELKDKVVNADAFSLARYNKQMEKIYTEVLQ